MQFDIVEPSKKELDLAHFDVMGYCYHLGFSIFRYIRYVRGKIYRTSKQTIDSMGQTDEIIFGNLYAREIILRYLHRFGHYRQYNERLVDNLASQLKEEIFRQNKYIPILNHFDTEEKLLQHFTEHAKQYIYKLFVNYDAFVYDSVGRFKIKNGGYTISVPVVYVRYLNKLKSIDYFKLTLPDKVHQMHVTYPLDMVLLLQHQVRSKIKFVRVHNLNKNLSSTINVGWYRRMYYNRRDFEILYDKYTNLDPELFIKASNEYTPNPWSYQCQTCSMRFVCHTYTNTAGKNVFKRTLFKEWEDDNNANNE